MGETQSQLGEALCSVASFVCVVVVCRWCCCNKRHVVASVVVVVVLHSAMRRFIFGLFDIVLVPGVVGKPTDTRFNRELPNPRIPRKCVFEVAVREIAKNARNGHVHGPFFGSNDMQSTLQQMSTFWRFHCVWVFFAVFRDSFVARLNVHSPPLLGFCDRTRTQFFGSSKVHKK